MRSKAKAAITLFAMACGGCVGDGLSPRENFTGSLSAAVYQENDHPADTQPTTAPAQTGDLVVSPAQFLGLPMRVGIVQIGEVAPPQSMMDTFRAHRELFSAVEPMPGLFNRESGGTSDQNAALANQNILAIRKTAANMGLNYVLIYGGTVDQSTTSTPLDVFNLTIVGLFVVPSDHLDAYGKAAGALIDVSTGHMVLNVSVDSKASRFLPTEVAINSREEQCNTIRQDLIKKVTDQTINRLAEHVQQSQ